MERNFDDIRIIYEIHEDIKTVRIKTIEYRI